MMNRVGSQLSPVLRSLKGIPHMVVSTSGHESQLLRKIGSRYYQMQNPLESVL